MFCSWHPMLTTVNFAHCQTYFTKKFKVVARPDTNIALRTCVWLHPAVRIKLTASAPTTNRRCLSIFYSGRVQGVGFLYTVKTIAAGFEIAGISRNLADGRVDLVAEGM